MAPDESDRSALTSASFASRVRPWMELLALTMIVAVCGAMLVALARGRWTVGPSVNGRTAGVAPANREAPIPADPLSIAGAQLDGVRTAPVAIIEFSDFQCPYCGRFARNSWPAIHREYVQSGKVLFAFREFPLEEIHKSALTAAEAAECAGDQGQFWKMHDLMFADQAHLEPSTFDDRARAAGLDVPRFNQCLTHGVAATIRADQQSGQSLDVNGTPTFFIGRLMADGRVKVVRRLSGALPATDFSAAIDEVLKSADSGDGR